MKLSCSSQQLYAGLQMVGSISATASTNPILQAVKIETVKEGLLLSVTDLEVGIQYLIPEVEVVSPGKAVIPEERIAGVLKDWGEEKVQIEVEGTTSRISGKGCSIKLIGFDPEEFPVIPSFEEKDYFEIEGPGLAEMVRRTSFACASERLRHTMTGVLLAIEGSTAKMVATDGRRLAVAKQRISNPHKVKSNSIIPPKAAHQLPRLVAEEKEGVKVKLEEAHMLVKTSKALLCSQLLEGQYPDYTSAIPAENDKRLEIAPEVLAAAIRRVAFITTEERHVIRIGLKKDTLLVRTETPEVGEGSIELPVDYKGSELEIGFNPDFLLDGLKGIGKEPVKMEFKDPNSAAVLKGGQDYLYVAMPIRLTEA
ncbi:MAG: DNA polymerase III subunit beta [Candidatus Brocadiales bacterium]|nr:DNA polymerase III subunit beta [Candidatus Brocadiales bacterium]